MDYSVQMTGVAASQQELVQCSQNIKTMLEQLDAESRQSLNQWEGSVRELYTRKKAEWDAAAAEMVNAAQKAGGQLGEINAAYHGAEQKGVQIFNG
jgi:uncharacterized protein YukE